MNCCTVMHVTLLCCRFTFNGMRWLWAMMFMSCGSQRRQRAMRMCAAPAARQPDRQPDKGPIRRCLRCGEERKLFYFPAQDSDPIGWVDCYACQHDLLLAAKPPERCVIILVGSTPDSYCHRQPAPA